MSNTIKRLKNGYGWIVALTGVLLLIGVMHQSFADSKRVTGPSTGSTILVDPKPDGSTWNATSIAASSDTVPVANVGGGQVKVWSRNPYIGKMRVTTALTTATTTSNIIVDSTTGISANDIVYCVPAGVSYTGQQKGFVMTVSVVGAGGTNLYASAVLTTNLSAGSYVYPLSLNYQDNIGSNSVSRVGESVFETIPDSPLRILLNCTVTNDLSITIK